MTFSGGYRTPIILPGTPYRVTRAQMPESRGDWPPFRDADRLDAYGVFEALVEDRPWEVFESLQLRPEQREKLVLAVGLPELLCNVWADALWGAELPPSVEFASDVVRERWDAIWRANGGDDVLGWEGVFGTAMTGTGVWKLRRARADEDRDEEVVIEEITPAIFFPRLHGDGRTLRSVALAWEEDIADPDDDRMDIWQRREDHVVEGGQYRITYRTRKKGRTEFMPWEEPGRPAVEEPEGVDFLPFVDMHAKRWRGRYWGRSELSRQLTLVDEIDNRLSDIAEILDYHGKPMLQVPRSTIVGGVFAKGADRTLGIGDAREADIARYITFDGQIDGQIAAIDKIVEMVLLTAEVQPSYFGMIEGGSWSGTALKLRMQNYLKKAARYQRKDEARLRSLARLALTLDGQVGEQVDPERVLYGDPLPSDDVENSQIETALVTAKLSSRRTSIARLRRVDDIDKELAAIDDEAEAEVTAAQNRAAPPAPAGLEAAGEPIVPPEA